MSNDSAGALDWQTIIESFTDLSRCPELAEFYPRADFNRDFYRRYLDGLHQGLPFPVRIENGLQPEPTLCLDRHYPWEDFVSCSLEDLSAWLEIFEVTGDPTHEVADLCSPQLPRCYVLGSTWVGRSDDGRVQIHYQQSWDQPEPPRSGGAA